MIQRGEKSVVDLLAERVEKSGAQIAFRYPEGEGFAELSWNQLAERVKHIGLGLRALGVETGDRCAIAAGTRMDWILADLGIMAGGAATTTVYPTTELEDRVYILSDSQSKVLFVEDQSQVDRTLAGRDRLPHIEKVVTFDGISRQDDWFMTFAELEDLGRTHGDANPALYAAVRAEVKPEAIATLIYTSGTTGRPKGVELLHDGWVAMAEGIAGSGLLSDDEHQFLWLPLSHSFGKAMLVIQVAVGFKTTVDGDLTKIIDNLAVVRPTFMASAPRIFEKVYNKVSTGAAKAGGAKFAIFKWSVRVARAAAQAQQQGRKPGLWLGFQHSICAKLVYSKLQARFGGNLRYFVSGSAPLSRELAEFFEGAGLPILEGYGLTESSAASFVNRPGANRIGTVGPAVGDLEIKIADDGEILLRGRAIMRGYHNLAEVSEETLRDEWLYTGDIGELDEAGYLKITDRKKNLIKTSGGKYVAPQKLEGQLKVLCPYLGQVLVHGDRRNYCTALVTLDPESIAEWAAQNGQPGATYDALVGSPAVEALVQDAVDRLNADLSRYETIKYFRVLPKDLTIEDGLLTPSLKVRRKKVEETYKELLDGMYEGSVAAL